MVQLVSLGLPSDVACLRYVNALASEVAVAGGLDAEEVDRWVLAVGEVAANAVLHGNRADPGRQVAVIFAVHGGALQVSVCDEGQGFDLVQVVVTAERRLHALETGGRGLLLARTCVDALTVDRLPGGGCCVRLTKRLGGAAKGGAM